MSILYLESATTTLSRATYIAAVCRGQGRSVAEDMKIDWIERWYSYLGSIALQKLNVTWDLAQVSMKSEFACGPRSNWKPEADSLLEQVDRYLSKFEEEYKKVITLQEKSP
jgi:hypothetical protein